MTNRPLALRQLTSRPLTTCPRQMATPQLAPTHIKPTTPYTLDDFDPRAYLEPRSDQAN